MKTARVAKSALAACAISLLAACAATSRTEPAHAASPRSEISATRMRAHLQFLADDLLEGRGTGTRGGAIACRYLATQAELLGLEPAAEDGSYLSPVPLVSTETLPGSTLRLDAPGEPGAPLRFLEDFVSADETFADRTQLDAPVVFVGHGIVAPEQHWNDYEGVDVRGKIVMVLANEPGRDDPSLFAGPALTYYGRWTYKYEEAARQGAIGALIVHTDATAGYGWSVVKNSWGHARPYPPSPKTALRCAAWIQEPVARDALARAGQDLDALTTRADARGFRAVETSLRASVDLTAKPETLRAFNVLALLRGDDPARANEVVVFTAHHDHLGIGPAENGDAIYNGAVDNASGCAALLEVARAFAEGPRPARSVLFAWVTAEEGGLRGSEHYATHPTFPPSKIVADVNLDGMPLVGDPLEVAPLGFDRSAALRLAVERAAATLGLRIVPDRDPSQGYFFRSDHFNFAKIGVPSINVGTGYAFRDKPEGFGRAAELDYRKNRYHRPADQFDPSWSFAGAVTIARFAYEVGRDLADSRAMPAFLPGDEFSSAQPDRR